MDKRVITCTVFSAVNYGKLEEMSVTFQLRDTRVEGRIGVKAIVRISLLNSSILWVDQKLGAASLVLCTQFTRSRRGSTSFVRPVRKMGNI